VGPNFILFYFLGQLCDVAKVVINWSSIGRFSQIGYKLNMRMKCFLKILLYFWLTHMNQNIYIYIYMAIFLKSWSSSSEWKSQNALDFSPFNFFIFLISLFGYIYSPPKRGLATQKNILIAQTAPSQHSTFYNWEGTVYCPIFHQEFHPQIIIIIIIIYLFIFI